MRSFLLAVIVLEALGLFGVGAALLFGLEEKGADRPNIPAFRPPAYDAVIGDRVRYRKLESKTQRMLGYLEYRVEWAEEYSGTHFGRTYRVVMVERDARGQPTRQRKIIIRPRDITHGWLPPSFDEDVRASVPGARAVIASIETTTVQVLRREQPGFLVQTVVPRDSLSDIAERFWISQKVPIFGVVRFERGEHVYVLDDMEDARS